MYNKNVAGTLAVLLGVLGTHHFYLGRGAKGFAQILAFFGSIFLVVETNGETVFVLALLLSIFLPIITGIIYWATPYPRWAAEHDPAGLEGYERQQQRAAAGPVRDTTTLKAEGVRYYRSGDFDLSAEAFQEAILVDPTDAVSHFNLACSYARLGRHTNALDHLERAVTFDLPNPNRILDHPALAELRAQPVFAAFRANNYRRQSHSTAPAAPPPAPPRVRTEPDLLEQINRLRELQDAGILTSEEFRRQREKLLG